MKLLMYPRNFHVSLTIFAVFNKKMNKRRMNPNLNQNLRMAAHALCLAYMLFFVTVSLII